MKTISTRKAGIIGYYTSAGKRQNLKTPHETPFYII